MEAALTPLGPAWGVAALTLPGESESGDRHVVEYFEGGVLVAVVDALGHGHEAARVAGLAAEVLQHEPAAAPATLIERCHAQLRYTRGATMSIARFDLRRRRLSWIGVGNVSGVLTDSDVDRVRRITLLLVRAGVVGDRIPELQCSEIEIGAAHSLILTSDGVRGEFTEMLPSRMVPQRLADAILARHATRQDDATALVFQCDGNP